MPRFLQSMTVNVIIILLYINVQDGLHCVDAALVANSVQYDGFLMLCSSTTVLK